MKKENSKTWYSIKAESDSDTAEILIYEEIGKSYWDENGIDAKTFVKELGNIKAKQINLRINSPGGSVYDGLAIYNALKRHDANITTYVDGIAASIASVIALAGDKVVMADNALFMIHNPWGVCIGDSQEMMKTAETLDKVRDAIITTYKNRTALTDDELKKAMNEETWYSAEEAKEVGFCDEVEGKANLQACARFDLNKFGFLKIPNAILHISKGNSPELYNNLGGEKMDKDKEEEGKPERKIQVMGNAEASEIVKLANQYGYPDKAADWVASGKSVEVVAKEILSMRKTDPIVQPGSEYVVNLTDNEQKQYSLARAIMNAVNSAEGKGTFSGFEKDVSDEIAKKLPTSYKAKGGFFVPLNLRNVRAAALDSKTATKGLETVFDQPGNLIEMLRNTSIVARLGAKILSGLTSPITFVKQTGALTIAWNGENPGSDVSESNITFGTVSLSPKTCQGTTAYSRQLLAQSSFDVENLVRNDFAISHALGWDLAALHGSGVSNEPYGIYNVAGVNSKAMGGTPTFAKLVDMTTECALDNALLGNLGWASTPGMAGKMMQTLVASAAGSAMIWSGNQVEGLMIGYKALASNQVKKTLGGGSDHGIIFGNWSDLIIGMWGAMELIVDVYAKKKQGLIEVTSFQMCDVAVRHPESFCVATGATI
ncbi:MAG: phage major capsid protein [Candidatus Jettenia caeni]|nr:MAG: phage major capsid protein [Candidatus Jettenia caeni]